MNQSASADNDGDDITLRLFIAIAFAPLAKVAALLQELQSAALQPDSGIRVVPETNLHITLKFLGPVLPSAIAGITAVLDHVITDLKPFVITFAGAGIFKDAFWLGVEPCDSLTALATTINQRLEPIGFQPETRPYIPHLTVARLEQKSRTHFQARLQQFAGETWGNQQVREVHVFKSAALPMGVQYSILHTSTFKHWPDI